MSDKELELKIINQKQLYVNWLDEHTNQEEKFVEALFREASKMIEKDDWLPVPIDWYFPGSEMQSSSGHAEKRIYKGLHYVYTRSYNVENVQMINTIKVIFMQIAPEDVGKWKNLKDGK